MCVGESGSVYCTPKRGGPEKKPSDVSTLSVVEKEISALWRPQWATFESESVPSKADQPSVFASKSGFAIWFSSAPTGGIGSQVDTSIPMSIVPGPKVSGTPVV